MKKDIENIRRNIYATILCMIVRELDRKKRLIDKINSQNYR